MGQQSATRLENFRSEFISRMYGSRELVKRCRAPTQQASLRVCAVCSYIQSDVLEMHEMLSFIRLHMDIAACLPTVLPTIPNAHTRRAPSHFSGGIRCVAGHRSSPGSTS